MRILKFVIKSIGLFFAFVIFSILILLFTTFIGITSSIKNTHFECSNYFKHNTILDASYFSIRERNGNFMTYLKTHTIKQADGGKNNGLLFDNTCYACVGLHGPSCFLEIYSYKGEYENIKRTFSCKHDFFITDINYRHDVVNIIQHPIESFFSSDLKFSFKDIDQDGDLDLMLTSNKDFNAAVWINEGYKHWHSEPKLFSKTNRFSIFLILTSRVIIIWIIYFIFGLPVLLWYRYSIFKRMLIMSLCPISSILSFITYNELFLFITLILYFIINIYTFSFLLIKYWDSISAVQSKISVSPKSRMRA